MSTCMDVIVQQDLFSGTMRMDVVIPEEDRYRVLTEILPWIGTRMKQRYCRSGELRMGNWENLGNRNGSAKVMNGNGSSARDNMEPQRKYIIVD